LKVLPYKQTLFQTKINAKAILNLKLSQKLSPQQIQLMKLIQLPTQAFEQRLLEEMNEIHFGSRKEGEIFNCGAENA
jgi:hypothetical protein